MNSLSSNTKSFKKEDRLSDSNFYVYIFFHCSGVQKGAGKETIPRIIAIKPHAISKTIQTA